MHLDDPLGASGIEHVKLSCRQHVPVAVDLIFNFSAHDHEEFKAADMIMQFFLEADIDLLETDLHVIAVEHGRLGIKVPADPSAHIALDRLVAQIRNDVIFLMQDLRLVGYLFKYFFDHDTTSSLISFNLVFLTVKTLYRLFHLEA